MPTGAPRAPRALPCGFLGFCRLPQGKIHRVPFRLVDFDPRPRLHIVQAASAQLAVTRELLHAVIDVALRRRIGITARDQGLNHADDVLHRLGDAREHIGTAHIERIHRPEIRGDIAIGDLLPRHALTVRRVDDFIVYIRKVLNVAHTIALAREIAPNDVPRDKGAGVPDMRIVIRRHAAAVNADFPLFERPEFLFPACHRIVNSKHSIHLYDFVSSVFRRSLSASISPCIWSIISATGSGSIS